jgi:hypothetical protein
VPEKLHCISAEYFLLASAISTEITIGAAASDGLLMALACMVLGAKPDLR